MMMLDRPGLVLVVDDEDSDVRLLVEAFREAGLPHRLDGCHDGEGALAYLRDPSKARPDLILLDINLPRKNGHEVLAAIRSDDSLAVIPVLMLTSSAADRDVTAAYRGFANGYVVKPVDVEALLDVARTIDAFWFKLARLPKP